MIYDVIIIGGGPAGLAAALYTCRARLSTVVIEKKSPGGELMDRERIENYPGYPGGVTGAELGSNMMTQAMELDAEFQLTEVTGMEIGEGYHTVKTAQGDFSGRTVIIAGGAHPRKLGVPGEDEFANKGVFYCATCDGPRFAGKVVAVAGGGDSGVTEALLLARLTSKVFLVEMMPQLTASKVLQERIASEPKIETRCGLRIDAIRGDDWMKNLEVVDTEGKRSALPVDGILVWIGLQANTDYLKGIVPLDKAGQIIVNAYMETEVPGIFAAGDIRAKSPMQVATAVGDGATAAISAGKFLQAQQVRA